MLSPDSRRAYLTLRGRSRPPRFRTRRGGETPGVSVVDVAGRKVLSVVKLGDQQLADFHGIFIPEAQR